MPKIKSHRGSMKRFKKTKKGKMKRSQAFGGHLKVKKSSKKKRYLRKNVVMGKGDTGRIKRLVS